MIVVNQIRCKKCGDEPFSKHRHDFVSCKCGAVAVDGGQDYLRRIGALEYMEEMSYSVPDHVVTACVDAVKWGRDTERNDFGIVLAVLRALKEHNKLVVELEDE